MFLELANELELVNGYVNSSISLEQTNFFFFNSSLDTPDIVKLKKERVVTYCVECRETLLAFPT